jgi:hypothetical protein
MGRVRGEAYGSSGAFAGGVSVVAARRFVVIADNSASSQAFTWEVKAVRADVAPLIVEE